MIFLLIATPKLKILEILSSFPWNLVLYKIRILFHYVKHILFYLWLKYEAIGTNIDIHFDSFFIKLCSGTLFKPYFQNT
jgi:hypothetical protein